jgi:hypothetical protein
MDEVAQRQWNESARIGIQSATGCCSAIKYITYVSCNLGSLKLLIYSDKHNYMINNWRTYDLSMIWN